MELQNMASIGSGNDLAPVQALDQYLNQCLLSIGPLGTNLSEILIKRQKNLHKQNAFENVNCKMLSIRLTHCGLVMPYGDIDLGQHWHM